MVQIGKVVGHSTSIWKPKGKLTVTKITTGKRSGLRIITATDESGQKFTGCDGNFKDMIN